MNRKSIPKPIRVLARPIYNYLNRIYIWLKVLQLASGKSFADKLTLGLSALLAPIVSLGKLNRWQNPMLAFDARLSVKGLGTFDVRPWTDDLWHVLPYGERKVLSWIKENVQPGDVFVDAGANIGLYTVFASALVGSNGKVISVEMMPETFNRLERHCKINHLENVTLFQSALSDKPGESVVARNPQGYFGQASISKKEMTGATDETVLTTQTLDQILGNLKNIAIIKMDLEGHEEAVLKAANASLAKTKNIIFESWTDVEKKSDPVKTILENNGFFVSKIDPRNFLATRK